MKAIGEFLAGVWEFVVGDDWVTALGVVAALALTALVSDPDAAWVVMPAAVAFLLTVSILREARRHDRS